MDTWPEWKRYAKQHEGVVPHMYLDTTGNVTVGVGNLLPSAAAAQTLAFVVRATNKAATAEEIAADYNSVKKLPSGWTARAYRPYTKLDLPAAKIEALFEQRFEEFKRELQLRFPGFINYPLRAQFALMDMAFNLGVSKIVNGFPEFTKAVRAQDWTKAAAESSRRDVPPDRNALVAQWFEEAATAVK